MNNMGISLNSLILRKISNGRNTSFWSDCWIDVHGPLKIRFPRLYALETCKTCSVADRWVSENGVWLGKWSWRRQPSGRATDELSCLSSLISGFVLNFTRDDSWTWSLEASGDFTVRSLSNIIQKRLLAIEDSSLSFRWNSWVPRKINVCAWRVSLNRLPTKDNLMRRGIALSSSVCLFCGKDEESRDHCFLLCPIIKIIWKKVWSWWRSPPSFSPSLDDILKGDFEFLENKLVSKLFHAVCLSLVWHIWRWRNRILHAQTDSEESSIRHEDIFPSLLRMSFLWTSNRASSNRFVWDNWIQKPGVLVQPISS
ncbi:RNA-directed DNA polymerase, eukaryota, Reverse transcriptase zinc-binding domain protein [Artemisia annua]|uniref:RNA-directed DNA polymerase, eukaryota, Reverse transcriptase zinc-binding domain protein n=1 Tax=Artemisia annua TaxID=35608 RepID=A0A2U1P340_ARTAN|nr:RNA-directed DNA polymerase, eukaryota, Reverse transcriptase zinc-binding domain protein [Artemisia annua]